MNINSWSLDSNSICYNKILVWIRINNYTIWDVTWIISTPCLFFCELDRMHRSQTLARRNATDTCWRDDIRPAFTPLGRDVRDVPAVHETSIDRIRIGFVFVFVPNIRPQF